MRDITLNIPCLPDLDLSANRRRTRHYMEQAKDTKAERLSAGLVLAQARRDINPTYDAGPRYLATPVFLSWTLFFPKGMRVRDWDNCVAALKIWQDAIVDLEWIKGDSPRYVAGGSVRIFSQHPQGPSMQLTISSVVESADV